MRKPRFLVVLAVFLILAVYNLLFIQSEVHAAAPTVTPVVVSGSVSMYGMTIQCNITGTGVYETGVKYHKTGALMWKTVPATFVSPPYFAFITDLTPGTYYEMQAYCKYNPGGITVYSDPFIQKTKVAPSVTITEYPEVAFTEATAHFRIEPNGHTINLFYKLYTTSDNQEVISLGIANGVAATTEMDVPFVLLKANTEYKVVPFATTEQGETYYCADSVFSTLGLIVKPSITFVTLAPTTVQVTIPHFTFPVTSPATVPAEWPTTAATTPASGTTSAGTASSGSAATSGGSSSSVTASGSTNVGTTETTAKASAANTTAATTRLSAGTTGSTTQSGGTSMLPIVIGIGALALIGGFAIGMVIRNKKK